METVRVPGPPALAVTHAGTGELVLFLHGIGGNRGNWTRQIGHFSRNARAAAWDMRGYGDSDPYEGSFSFADARQDIERVLDYFDAHACHLVGLSLGGRIAYGFARHRPERVLSLTACSAVPFGEDMPPETRRRFLEQRMAPLVAGATPADIASGVARSLAGPHCTSTALDELTASIAALHREAYLKTLEGATTCTERFDLSQIRVPTHVVAAGHDTLFSPAKLAAVASAIPDAKYSVLADAGHLSNLEFPAAFNAVVEGFLSSLRSMTNARPD